VIYLETSAALAELLAEDRKPNPVIWKEPLVASRLLEYEVWTRLNSRSLATSHGEHARDLLAGVSYIELTPIVLARALEPFPLPVRTLDALHLATIEYLRGRDVPILLASFDDRMLQAAKRLGILTV
jgi:hypothetical protein